MERTIKWGIMGPGIIAHHFVRSIMTLDDGIVTAVGSRDIHRAIEFSREYGIRKAYGSYEDLVADPDIDVVYIATPHPLHKQCTLLSLNAGKAVLTEKPFTINAKDTRDIVLKAREKKLFLMEAMWTRFMPAIVKVREWLDKGLIGDIQCLKADIGYDSSRVERVMNPELGGGSLLDIGVYPVSFASMIFGTQPAAINSIANIGATGVDEQCSLLFGYDKGAFAGLFASVTANTAKDAWIYGTKGYIYIPDFHKAKEASLVLKDGTQEAYKHEFKEYGYQYEAIEVMRCIRDGKTESAIMPLDESISIMETMDTLRQQWKLYYPGE